MKVEIVDYAAIPSTMTLLKLDALSHEEAQELQDRMPNLSIHLRLLRVTDLRTCLKLKKKRRKRCGKSRRSLSRRSYHKLILLTQNTLKHRRVRIVSALEFVTLNRAMTILKLSTDRYSVTMLNLRD